jgi:hypothetical protein
MRSARNARWRTALQAWAGQGVATTSLPLVVTRWTLIELLALLVAWPPTKNRPTASYYDTNLLDGGLIHGVIDDCCIDFGFHSIGVWSSSISRRSSDSIWSASKFGLLEPREQSSSELLGYSIPFSFLYPMSRSRGPGHYHLSIGLAGYLWRVCAALHDCPASVFISFV